MKNIHIMIVLGLVFLGVVSSFVINKNSNAASPVSSTSLHKGISVTLFHESTCGCCKNYAKYLENNGVNVRTVTTSNTNNIKNNFNIPSDKRSCHTMKMGDYVIEGHMPLEVIDKILKEKPDVDILTLPGMPSGSPGMPGNKFNDFTVYSVNNGEVKEFMKV